MNDNDIPLTPEQSRAAAAFLKELFAGVTCPWCHMTIEEKEQIGRSVYVKPCGCRLYQGKLKGQGKS